MRRGIYSRAAILSLGILRKAASIIVPVFHAEIHIRGLAEQLGITSASVSEMISKLQRKGLVQKSADKNNLSRLKLSLTAMGQLAHEEHMRYHNELNQIIAAELKDVSPEQISFLHDFFDNIRGRIDYFQFQV